MSARHPHRSPVVRDLVADWRRWTASERFTAALLLAMLAAVANAVYLTASLGYR
jgi:hypothetical protein